MNVLIACEESQRVCVSSASTGTKNLVNDWCDVKADSPDPELVRDCIGFEQMTNGDRIRSMSDEELAEFLEAVTDACYDPSINHCRNCPMLGHRVGEDFCNITNWLKQLAEE